MIILKVTGKMETHTCTMLRGVVDTAVALITVKSSLLFLP